jgi:flagellar biosynthesis protein
MAKPTLPLRSAIALAYQEADGAPRVVAKGRGLIAEEIIARAQEQGIFVHQSADLVALLMQVDLDDRIPPQLYAAVAELLAWLYSIEQGHGPLTEVAKAQGSPHRTS